ALALAPGYAEGWSNRGNVLKDLGRREEALQSVDRALALDPRLTSVLVTRAPADPAAHHHRGILMMDLQRLPEALAAFDRALALRPGDGEAEAAKAMALLLAG